jgi:hypothetical protein
LGENLQLPGEEPGFNCQAARNATRPMAAFPQMAPIPFAVGPDFAAKVHHSVEKAFGALAEDPSLA